MMTCPECGHDKSRVFDSRPNDTGRTLRRRRECRTCKHRWTTYEAIAESSEGGRAYSPKAMDGAERVRLAYLELDETGRKVLSHAATALRKARRYDEAVRRNKERKKAEAAE